MKDVTGGSYMQMPITNSFSVTRSLQWQNTGISLTQTGLHSEPRPPYAVNQSQSRKIMKSNSSKCILRLCVYVFMFFLKLLV